MFDLAVQNLNTDIFDLSGFGSARAELRYCRVDGVVVCKSDWYMHQITM